MEIERRVFIGAFKAQITLETLKERKLAELSKPFEIDPNMIK